MTPIEFKAYCREQLRDQEKPYLWSDTALWAWINDAQDMFTRLTGGLRDSSSALCELAIVADEPWVPVSDRILFVRDARLASSGKSLSIVNYEDLLYRQTGVVEDYGQRVGISTADLELTGAVTQVVVGMEEDKLRLVRIPTAADTLLLVIDRRPLCDVGESSLKFEISSKHVLHLYDWVKHLAYKQEDSESFDRGKSDKGERAFRDYCMTVRLERERQRHKPRLIQYGGI
jgi:hypothetical protein